MALLPIFLQDDIRGVLKEGRLLLSNLETLKAAKRDVAEEREIQADMETVHRWDSCEKGLEAARPSSSKDSLFVCVLGSWHSLETWRRHLMVSLKNIT